MALALQQIPKVYLDYVMKYALPYTAGFVAGNVIYSGVGAATSTVPRLFTLGVDDATTIAAGAGLISKNFIGQYSVPVGSGILTSWILRKVIGLIGSGFAAPDTSGLTDSINSLVGIPNDDKRTFAGTASLVVA